MEFTIFETWAGVEWVYAINKYHVQSIILSGMQLTGNLNLSGMEYLTIVFAENKYAEKGYFVRIEPPYRKDWNEDLQALRAQTQALKRAKHTQRDVEI